MQTSLQPQLFVFGADDSIAALSRPNRETTPGLSKSRDKLNLCRIGALINRLAAVCDPLDQAGAAIQLRDAAEALVAVSIRDANHAGRTWREIGARLGVPFQTLHARYGTHLSGDVASSSGKIR